MQALCLRVPYADLHLLRGLCLAHVIGVLAKDAIGHTVACREFVDGSHAAVINKRCSGVSALAVTRSLGAAFIGAIITTGFRFGPV